ACFNIDKIWLSLNFDFFMQNLLAYTLRENSTFGSNYFVGGLPILLGQGWLKRQMSGLGVVIWQRVVEYQFLHGLQLTGFCHHLVL
ncbi:hypothetical protein SE949_15445, partial [Legionella pneumophila subsp. fraseri]|nr:hypothetical protein [Legionella pneumophila subsp. fraseri]